jgi:hypothetical protein
LLDDAKSFLEAMLGGGPQLRSEIYEAADGDDISEATLRRAKAELHVISYKQPQPDGHGPWLWELPENYSEAFADFMTSPTPEMIDAQVDLMN